MQTESDTNPKHQSLRLTSERHSPTVRRLAIALFSTVTLAALGFGIYLFTRPPESPNPYRQAAELDTAIHTDPRFANVRAVCEYPSVTVIAFGDLAGNTKSDLERLVHLHTPNPQAPVRYRYLTLETEDSTHKQ